MSVSVRPLLHADDRSSFRSGNADLDRFFARFAGQNQFRHHVGVTYVAVDAAMLLGFVTVAPSEVSGDALPTSLRKRLPEYPLPVLRLARLAVDQSATGRGVGGHLVRFVFALAHRMANELGCVGVVVDAKEESVGFYQRPGFIDLDVVIGESGERPAPKPMFLPLGSMPVA